NVIILVAHRWERPQQKSPTRVGPLRRLKPPATFRWTRVREAFAERGSKRRLSSFRQHPRAHSTAQHRRESVWAAARPDRRPIAKACPPLGLSPLRARSPRAIRLSRNHLCLLSARRALRLAFEVPWASFARRLGWNPELSAVQFHLRFLP